MPTHHFQPSDNGIARKTGVNRMSMAVISDSSDAAMALSKSNYINKHAVPFTNKGGNVLQSCLTMS